MQNKRLSPKAIFHFMQVYYEVFDKIIPHEQAEKEANILMKLLHMAITSNEIRTGKRLLQQRNTKIKDRI